MKSRYYLLGLVVFISALVVYAGEPEQINVSLQKSFIPQGFDDNDKTQVTVVGTFPDTCHKVGPYSVKFDEKTKTVAIHQTAYRYDAPCVRVFVPFAQVIDLGILKFGEYKIVDAVSSAKLGTLNVAVAKTSAADDYLYAPVSHAFVRSDAGKNELLLSGKFMTRCMRIKDVVINYTSDTIIVQPIAESTVSDRTQCETEKVRFQFETPLKNDLHGIFLLHVRTMDGQAINQIVDLE